MLEFNVDSEKLNKYNLKTVDKQGFVFPDDEFITNIPEENKTFPTEISEMSNAELLDRMAVFTALFSSVAVNEALAMTEVAGYERELEIRKGQVMSLSQSSKVTDKRQEALIDKVVVELQEKLTVSESRLKLLSALRASYDKYLFIYSRCLTVRGEEAKL